MSDQGIVTKLSPMSVPVWDDQEQTKLSYTAPQALAARHALTEAVVTIR
jgi:hypothetical protein